MSRWTFFNISFRDPDAENPEENADGALRIIPITRGSVEPGDPFAVRVHWYHPTASVVINQPQGEDATVTLNGSGTESIAETVSLSFGKGTASFPSVSGNTNVYDSGQAGEPVGYKEVTYSVNYLDYNLVSSTVGEHDGVFLFSDGSNITVQKFTVETAVCDENHPDLCDEPGICLSEGGQWVDGACVFPDDPAYPDDPDNPEPDLGESGVYLQATGGGEVEIFSENGDSVFIRCYLYHWNPDVINSIDGYATLEAYHPGLLNHSYHTLTTEQITETVQLKWGVGNTQHPSTDGETLVTVPADYSKAFSETTVTYTAYYRDFELSGSSVGTYPVAIWFADHSAETSASVTVVSAEPEPVYRAQTLEIYSQQDNTVLAGVSVDVDGNYIGDTDANGRITTDPLPVGSSHTLRVYGKTGYQDSDEDDIANDNFVAE